MEINYLIEKIKEECPDKAIDISESLDLLRTVINDTIEIFGDKMNSAVLNRDFKKISIYKDMAESIHQYEKKIEELISLFEIDEIPINEETDEETEKRTIPNYEKYIVDNKIEHTLYENFTHKRPFGFKLNEGKIIEASTWKDILVKTCEILMTIDENKFMSFENNDTMNGKKNKYFSVDPNLIRNPRKIGNKIYIETNQSGNSIRNLIIKLLKEYNFKISDYKVYFRADYTNLNNK
ncbi:hypothetical protein [Defluviitalea phaphyphila]|uniref:hypothetical protein n=1 Tax=Defluviitalea phaphyphila TaxID=1473580 RepID=UPI000731E112|nr:hypothetical protein [Defluviitalea phaphyphila]